MKIFPIIAVSAIALICASANANDDTSTKDAGSGVGHVESVVSVSHCPSDMVEVEGDYCPNVQAKCLYNTEIDGTVSKKPVSDLWACGEFQQPTVCLSEHKIHMHYCIDRYEWPNKQGQKPQDWMTWYDAKKAVESVDKRLCTHREWTFAAEGPNMHPLPYGNGYQRDSNACNFDRPMCQVDENGKKHCVDPSKAKAPDDDMSQQLRAYLVPSGSKLQCVSDFGVYDMSGNVDEWVVNEGGATECPKGAKCEQISYISGLMGGHVWHVRNASRPMTTAHYPGFGWYETGTRACRDIE